MIINLAIIHIIPDKMSSARYKLDDANTIESIIDWINNGELILPIIQRKLVWDSKHKLEYIKFLLEHEHCIIPIIVNRKICNNSHKYFLYDGHNRCTTIHLFITKPLDNTWGFLEEIVSYLDQYQEVKLIFLKMRENELNLGELNYNFNIEREDMAEKVRVIVRMRKHLKPEHQDVFDKYLDVLRDKYKSKSRKLFTMFSIPVGIFNNCSNAFMHSIYKSLNMGAVNMSDLDLLFPMLYSYEVTRLDDDIKIKLHAGITMFLEDKVSTSTLSAESIGDGYEFNLYLCLIGLQYFIDDKFSNIIKKEKHKADTHLPNIFKLFEYIVIKKRLIAIEDTDKLRINSEFNSFCKYILEIMNFLGKIKADIDIQFIGSTKLVDLKLSANSFITLVCYIYGNMLTDGLMQVYKRILTYNIFISDIEDKEIRELFKKKSPLDLGRQGGNFVEKKCLSILEKTNTDKLEELTKLDDTNLKELYKVILAEYIRPENDYIKKHRTKLSLFYNFVMGIYFNRNISRHHANNVDDFEVEHIFAYKSSWPSATEIDINRLGNLVWLPKKLNRSKGKNIIQESQLYKDLDIEAKRQIHTQFGYPELDVCRRIWDCSSESIISAEEYNQFCTAREENYMHSFINYLS